MTPWRPGDPVGRGAVFLPTPAIRAAYHAACAAERIDATARAVLALPTLPERRARIEQCPERDRDALRARVTELWSAR